MGHDTDTPFIRVHVRPWVAPSLGGPRAVAPWSGGRTPHTEGQVWHAAAPPRPGGAHGARRPQDLSRANKPAQGAAPARALRKHRGRNCNRPAQSSSPGAPPPELGTHGEQDQPLLCAIKHGLGIKGFHAKAQCVLRKCHVAEGGHGIEPQGIGAPRAMVACTRVMAACMRVIAACARVMAACLGLRPGKCQLIRRHLQGAGDGGGRHHQGAAGERHWAFPENIPYGPFLTGPLAG